MYLVSALRQDIILLREGGKFYMNKDRVLEITEKMTKGDIRYFMGNYAYDNKSDSKEWHNKFVEYIKNDYAGMENTFMECVNIFNEYYWFNYLKTIK